MLRRTAQWILVLALSFSIGLQWALLQSAAWVGMVVAYSHETTLPRAIVMTFDGKHPCRLCRTVEERGVAHAKQEMRGALMKLELAAPESDEFIEERRVAVGVAMELSPTARMRRIAPPLPPPERLG